MGERIRAFDWASHPMGPPQHWPAALRMAMSLCLNSSFPTAIYWGPQLHILYNDAWSVIPADKHPGILGQPARQGWSDIWDIVGPQLERVFGTGQGEALYGQMLPMVRAGRRTETWWNYSFTAIRDADHGIGGIFNQGNEITEAVLARRADERELGRWREIFEQAPAAVALLRSPQHVFEFANESYRQLVGGRDLIGRSVAQALPEVASQGFVALLDGVYESGQTHVGKDIAVKLHNDPAGPAEDRVLNFVYQPLRDATSQVEGILVLATDMTDRSRAEAALRLSNWELGEERARLASMVKAEQRAQQGLRRLAETLEAHVRTRTEELSKVLEARTAELERLRAVLEAR